MRLLMWLSVVGPLIALQVPEGRCEEPNVPSSRDRQVISDLIRDLDRPDATARLDAVLALTWIGSPAREAVPKLIATLKDDEREVARSAAAAILEIGADHPHAGPALVVDLGDPTPEVRLEAMSTIEKYPIVQRAATGALETRIDQWGRYLEPRAAEDLPSLIAALADPDRSVRATSEFCLWAVREQTAPANAALTAALEDSDEEVRLLIAATLIAKPPHNPKAEAILVAALPALKTTKLNPRTSVAAIEFYADVLKHLGAKALPGIPHLITAGLGYDGQSGSPEGAAERALKELGPVAVPDLVRVLRGNDRVLRSKAARVLGMIGPEARASVPVLVALLDDNEGHLAEVAGHALGKIGPAAREAIPALEQRLRAPEIRTRV
jgi:HEAT repeat protein